MTKGAKGSTEFDALMERMGEAILTAKQAVEAGRIVRLAHDAHRELPPDAPVFCDAECALEWLVEEVAMTARFFGLTTGTATQDSEGYLVIDPGSRPWVR